MYLAADQADRTSVWHSEKLNMDFASLDGFSYYLWRTPEAMVPDLQQKKCLAWLEERLAPTDEFPIDGGLKAKALWLLKRCPLTLGKPVDQVIAVAEGYDRMASDDRYKQMGDEAYACKGYAKAIGYYKKALTIRQRADVLNNLGLIYMISGEMDRAEIYFNKSIQLDSGPAARMNLVRLHLVTGAYDQALGHLNHVAALYDRPDIWYYFGRVYEGLGKDEESVTAYVRALDEAADVRSVEAFVSRAMAMDRKVLVDHFLVSRELPAYLKGYMMARLDFCLGDMTGYRQELESAVEAANHPDLILELAVCQASSGQVIQGLTLLETVGPEVKDSEWHLYVRSLVAQAAGNDADYNKWVDRLRDTWKDSARQMVQR